jgi:hypothetical protein
MDHNFRNTGMEMGNWLYMVEGFYFAVVLELWFFFQVKAVLAVKMRTPRMIQIHGTTHIGVNTALLQVSYWHYGISYLLVQRELNNF